MYLMISTYLVPLDEVDQVRGEHLAFLDTLEEQGVLVTAGRQNPPAGGVVILDVDDEERARQLIEADPYVRKGVAQYAAIGWQPARGALAAYGRA